MTNLGCQVNDYQIIIPGSTLLLLKLGSFWQYTWITRINRVMTKEYNLSSLPNLQRYVITRPPITVLEGRIVRVIHMDLPNIPKNNKACGFNYQSLAEIIRFIPLFPLYIAPQ